ncbi:MAG: hypothetical protein ACO3ID_05505 [Candidatus Nanopelagicales bacterium]|jgi:hypothetical protein
MHAVTGIAGATRSLRRIVITLLLAVGVTLSATSAPAHAADPATRGLFGPQDPTYDGVDRQATAILGLVAVGAKVPKLSVDWLLSQQCEDGSFAAFRADPQAPCSGPDLVTYTGPNTNSTSLAAMALDALATRDGKGTRAARRAALRAVTWLVAQQQPDGGWEWLAGLGSDSTSTSMTLTAIGKPGSRTHRRGIAFLKTAMQTATDCGIAFTPDSPIVDPLTTSWAFLATQGSLPYSPHRGGRNLTSCTDPADLRAAGSWLASSLAEGEGEIASAFEPGVTDWNVTALATLGVTQRDGSTRAMRLGLAALQANVDAYVVEDEVDRPAPLGTLLMVAHATKSDPRDFGGVDLVKQLRYILQK